MLITFISFVALFNALLDLIRPGLTLQEIFGWVFSPVAFLLGVDPAECDKVGTLLGIKLAANEHVAYLTLSGKLPDEVMRKLNYEVDGKHRSIVEVARQFLQSY